MSKEYLVPDEIGELDARSRALNDLVNLYVKMPFGYKKAIRARIDQLKARRNFWNAIYKLYPDIADKKLQYDFLTKKLEIVNEAK